MISKKFQHDQNLTIVKTVNLNKRDNTVKARITSQEMATSEGSQFFKQLNLKAYQCLDVAIQMWFSTDLFRK